MIGTGLSSAQPVGALAVARANIVAAVRAVLVIPARLWSAR